jgi:hypothetical protein
MSLESDIMDGNIDNVVQHIPKISDDRIGSLFLFAVTFEREEIATKILEAKWQSIDIRIIEEVLKSAAVHNEAELTKKIIELRGKELEKQVLLEVIKIAAVEKNIDVINAIAQDNRVGDYINTEDKDNPHLIKLAVDTGDYSFLEKVLELPKIDVEFHHLAYSDKIGQHRMSELLKLKHTQEKHRVEKMDMVYDYEKDMAAVGPHMQAELERRKRVLSQSRYRL